MTFSAEIQLPHGRFPIESNSVAKSDQSYNSRVIELDGLHCIGKCPVPSAQSPVAGPQAIQR